MSSVNLATVHRVNHWFYSNNLRFPAWIGYRIAFLIFNSAMPPAVPIGRGTRFAYGGIGVVIHERSVIGRECTIGQGITIGGRSGLQGVPHVEDNVYLGAGCRILGPVTIGRGSVVGANSVVIHDVPPNSVAVGVPARIVGSPDSDQSEPLPSTSEN